jgi:endonuclease YncB( thermonuclease family)
VRPSDISRFLRLRVGRFLLYFVAVAVVYWLVFDESGLRFADADKTLMAPAYSVSPSAGGVFKGYESKTVFVTEIFDGDTVRTRDGEVIRYLGIDTPEMNYGKGRPQPGAVEATARNRQLVYRKNIVLLIHPMERKDAYGRTLAYLLLSDGDEYASVNHTLVAEGYAREAYGKLRVPARIKKISSSALK